MAQYRFSAKIVSRGAGQSVIAKAAYNAREALRDERTGEVKDYSRAKGLEFSGIFAPQNAPDWMRDRAKLWNAVELQEDGTTRRSTAQLARNVELNLPHELNADQRRQLVRDFVREQFVRDGMVADVAIHAPDRHSDERNYHAHILLTLREIEGDGFSPDKARHWNSKEVNLRWREKWAELGARYLERAGFKQEAERYSYAHFSLEKQATIALERGDLEHAEALDREATKHKGPHVVAMERRGIDTERSQTHNETVEANKLRAELREVEKEIAEHQQRQAARTDPANLKGAMLDIYTAYQQSDSPKAFAAALKERGIALAVVTKAEAEQSRSDAATARVEGRFAPTFRAGEIVAVTSRGYAYRLSERTTGADFVAVEKFLQTRDRSTLQSIDAATRTLSQQRRETWHDKQEELRTHGQRHGIVDFAIDEERITPQTKGRDAREIYAAFDESNRPKPFRGDAFRARAFMAALDEQGIALASVTKEEAARTHREAAFAREAGRYAPSYRAGEIVAVTLQGTVHRLNERTTGLESATLETRLQKIDRSRLQGLDATKAAMTERAAQRREEITEARMDRARNPLDFRTENSHAAIVRGLGSVTEKAVTTARKTDKALTRTVGKALDAVANLVGGLLSFFFPDAPKTREHIARIVDEKERTAHASSNEADRAARRASYDYRHAEVMKTHREEARQQDERGEYRKRHGDRERER